MYQNSVPARIDGNQENYSLPAADLAYKTPAAVLFAADLGKDKSDVTITNNSIDAKIELTGFKPDSNWNRPISWRISAVETGKIQIKFRPSSAKRVMFYLTDGNSYWRSSIAKYQDKTELAQQLHDGKWLTVNLSEVDHSLGIAEFEFQKLTGDDISISGVILQ